MKTLLLDRDGVLNPLLDTEDGKISPQSVHEFEFYSGAEKALKIAIEAGYRILVFTNQPDVGKDWRPLNKDRLEDINSLLKEKGVEKVYACTHGPRGGRENSYYRENGDIVVCNCRKPRPGLIERAADDYGVDFSNSYVIGDNVSDLEAARNFEEGRGVEFGGKFLLGSEDPVADRSFDNIYTAVKYIVEG